MDSGSAYDSADEGPQVRAEISEEPEFAVSTNKSSVQVPEENSIPRPQNDVERLVKKFFPKATLDDSKRGLTKTKSVQIMDEKERAKVFDSLLSEIKGKWEKSDVKTRFDESMAVLARN
jgi:hypothetical protein